VLRIGLTGGIGSGKTTVGRLFAALGVPVLDADEIARRLAQPGEAGYEAIVAHFGPGLLSPEGGLDRAKLRERVFAEPEQRRQLESLLHPLVFDGLEQAVAALRGAVQPLPYCILSIPLLLETHSRRRVDRVLVVDVPESVQIERVQQRDGLDPPRIGQILAAQCTRQQRLAAADEVIHNEGSPAEAQQQVAKLHRLYLDLAE
jgi:dephospho-CoA kinase